MGLRLLLLLLLLVPKDAPKLGPLQIAWASQYEWIEHDAKTVALDFTYEGSETAAGGDEPTWTVEGQGSVVIGEKEVIRVHLPGAGAQTREWIAEHISWIADRFVRLPYEEKFKDVDIAKPEELAGGTLKVVAGDEVYRLKDDRITGIDRVVPGSPIKRIKRYTEVFDVQPMPSGYAHLGSRALYTSQDKVGDKTRTTENDARRKLELGYEDDAPFPKTYTFKHKKKRTSEGVVVDLTLSFGKPKTNQENAVVGDPAARDLLKAAWDQRYTLPLDTQIEGKWKLDSPGAQARWSNGRYEGSFLVHGLDDISVKIEMDRADRWSASILRDVNERIVGELKWLFDHVRPTPFEEAFKGCGFTKADDEGSTVIQVAGSADVLAFRLEKGLLVGRLDNTADGDLWWDFKWKKLSDSRMRLESSTRRLNRKKYEEKISYSKKKKLYVPKKWTRFKSWVARGKTASGLDKWELTGLKVSAP